MYAVFDLDGTLCNIDHRLPLIKSENPDWDAFYDACEDDHPNWPIIKTLCIFMRIGYRVEIWTGRSDQVRDKTEAWLGRHGIWKHVLTRMRPAGDHSTDVKLKKAWLKQTWHEHTIVPELVFEDRTRVVEMWRSEGITCCQVAKWEDGAS